MLLLSENSLDSLPSDDDAVDADAMVTVPSVVVVELEEEEEAVEVRLLELPGARPPLASTEGEVISFSAERRETAHALESYMEIFKK